MTDRGHGDGPATRLVLLRDAAALTVAMTTIAGFLSYLFLRYVYVRFYSDFGLRPEDLGLGYIEILTNSALSFVVGLVIPASLVGLGVLLIMFGRPPSRVFLSVIAVTGSIVTLWQGPLLLGIGLFVVCLLALLPSPLSLPRELMIQIVAAFFLLYPVIVVFKVSLISVDVNQISVKLGQAITSNELGLPTVSAVELDWIRSTKRPEDFPVCPMYLGEHNGTVFVFDVPNDRTLRIPSQSVLVKLPTRPKGHDLDQCLAPTQARLDRAAQELRDTKRLLKSGLNLIRKSAGEFEDSGDLKDLRELLAVLEELGGRSPELKELERLVDRLERLLGSARN